MNSISEEDNAKKMTITNHHSIRQAMECINQYAKGIVLVVDDEYLLLGTITDGDIRRAILSGITLNTPVSEILKLKARGNYSKPITAHFRTPKRDILDLMQKHAVRQVPLVDEEGRLISLVTFDQLLPEQVPSLQAVIMAGGFGTRLRPLTEDLPKPMLPIGDRPLLELIIERLRKAGIHHLNITTHYKPEKITEYFGDGREFGVKLNYVSEDTPLGTAGALGLIETPQEPLLVINGDILTQVNFRAMLAYHRESEADLTVAARQYEVRVPYGVLECEGNKVRQVREKPVYNYFVNAGIYLLQPDVSHYIPNGERFDMTDLIETLISDGRTVVTFPITEYWLDIGQHADYEQAQEDMKSGRF